MQKESNKESKPYKAVNGLEDTLYNNSGTVCPSIVVVTERVHLITRPSMLFVAKLAPI